MAQISRQVGSFRATDPGGKVLTVYVHQMYSVSYRFEGTSDAPSGPRSLKLADGSAVNRMGKGEYEVVANRVRLTSDDSAAT